MTLHTFQTRRPIFDKYFGLTNIIRSCITRRTKDGFSRGSARTLAWTPCPEEFKSRTGIDCKGSVETNVVDACLASWCGGDPFGATTEDVWACGTFVEDMIDSTAGFTTRIGRGCTRGETGGIGQIESKAEDRDKQERDENGMHLEQLRRDTEKVPPSFLFYRRARLTSLFEHEGHEKAP